VVLVVVVVRGARRLSVKEEVWVFEVFLIDDDGREREEGEKERERGEGKRPLG
jgi:hypothetical protein